MPGVSRKWLALVMSGFRCCGSSPGSGRCTIFELEPVCLIASSASCREEGGGGEEERGQARAQKQRGREGERGGGERRAGEEGRGVRELGRSRLLDRELARVADVDWADGAGLVHQLHQPVDEVVDKAEGARLLPLAVHGDVLPVDGLPQAHGTRLSPTPPHPSPYHSDLLPPGGACIMKFETTRPSYGCIPGLEQQGSRVRPTVPQGSGQQRGLAHCLPHLAHKAASGQGMRRTVECGRRRGLRVRPSGAI